MTPIKKVNRNFYANAIGPIAINIINLLVIPLYLKYAGAEAYGLIGLFASMQAFVTFFFSGLGTAFNREISRLSSLKERRKEIADLIVTLTRTYFLVSFFATFILIILSIIAANTWITKTNLSTYTVTISLIILSISMFFSLFSSFYRNGLLGIQNHVTVNILSISHSLLRAIFGLLVLIIFEGNVVLFFIAFGLAGFFNMLLCRSFFLRNIQFDNNFKGKFVKKVFKNNMKLTSNIAAISLTAMLITQMDKILLSGILPLNQFGFYVIASTIGITILNLTSTTYNTFFPRMVQLHANNKIKEYEDIFRLSCKLVSIYVWPISFGIIFFGNELLYLWLRDLELVNTIHLLVCFITIGSALNGALNMIYMITIVHGNPRIFLFQNLIIICILPFLLLLLIDKYGVLGAAISWVLINSSSMLIMPFLTHFHVAKVNLRAWFINDNFMPAIFSLIYIWFFSSLNLDFKNVLLNSTFSLSVMISCSLLLLIQSDYTRRFIFKLRIGRS